MLYQGSELLNLGEAIVVGCITVIAAFGIRLSRCLNTGASQSARRASFRRYEPDNDRPLRIWLSRRSCLSLVGRYKPRRIILHHRTQPRTSCRGLFFAAIEHLMTSLLPAGMVCRPALPSSP